MSISLLNSLSFNQLKLFNLINKLTCDRGLAGDRAVVQRLLQLQRSTGAVVTSTRQPPLLLQQLDADSTVQVEVTSANACCSFLNSLE